MERREGFVEVEKLISYTLLLPPHPPEKPKKEREREKINKEASKLKLFFSPAKHNNLETSQVNTYHQKNNYLKNSRSKTPNCLSFSHKQTLQKYKFK